MKYFFFLVFLLSIHFVYAQKLTLTYEFDASSAKEKLDNEIKNNRNEVNQGTLLTRSALDLLHFFTYTLKIDDSKSHFFLNNELGPENDDPTTYAIARAIANKGEYYQDNIENVVLIKKSTFGKSFLIESTLNNYNWTISNLEEKIYGYKTYKATTTIKDLDREGGYREIDVEVWFTPEIPINFGPEGYGGLPGLILKKCQGNTCFNLVNIRNKENSISLPKDKRTSYKTYFEFLEKMRDQRKN